jgi:sulfonate transport system ATP-binding protein
MIARAYAVSASARGHRSHPDAIALRDRLLADLGVDAERVAT